MKYLLQLAVALILMELLVVSAALAAPGDALSSGADHLDGDRTVVNEAGKGSGGSDVFSSKGTHISRSRTCPITKTRPLIKAFGYVGNGNIIGLVFLLQATLPISGRTPGNLHRSRPAGRSP